MQLKAVCAVTMSHLFLKTFRQIDDFDRLERAFLDAHTTSVTEVLRDEANL